jgi:hypothetical protein
VRRIAKSPQPSVDQREAGCRARDEQDQDQADREAGF